MSCACGLPVLLCLVAVCAAGYGTPEPEAEEGPLICSKCEVGTFSPKAGDRVCQHCPAGTLSIDLSTGRFGPGGTQCLACPAGLVPSDDKSGCRCPATHTGCRCPAGWASLDINGAPPCISCGANNTFANRLDYTGSTSCVTCPTGSQATDGTGCVCKPGFYSDDGTAFAPGGCVTCPKGSVTAMRGSNKCVDCPYGHVSNADRTECTKEAE